MSFAVLVFSTLCQNIPRLRSLEIAAEYIAPEVLVEITLLETLTYLTMVEHLQRQVDVLRNESPFKPLRELHIHSSGRWKRCSIEVELPSPLGPSSRCLSFDSPATHHEKKPVLGRMHYRCHGIPWCWRLTSAVIERPDG